MADETATIRADIKRYFESVEPFGATCDAVEDQLGLRHQTASARINELWHTLHVIEDSGRRRRTRSGRMAIVYVMKR